MVIFIGGVLNGVSFTTFGDIIPLKAGDASHLSAELLKWLNNSGIDLSKWSAIGSDGASTLAGPNDGVAFAFSADRITTAMCSCQE